MPRRATTDHEAASLLKTRIRAIGWTIDGFLLRLAERGYVLERATFDNYCRAPNPTVAQPKRRNRGFPPEPQLITALVQVLALDAPPAQRWTPSEALQFAQAVGLDPAGWAQLGPCFADQTAFQQALAALSPANAQVQMQAGLAMLDQLPLHQIPARMGPPLRRFGPLPSPAEPFVGREGELQQAAYLLKTTPAVRLLVCGLPGLGKTTFAAELAHRYGQFFQGGVFFFVADQLADLRRDLLECGTTMLLTDPASQAATSEQRLRLIRTAFEHLPPALLILDNIDDLPFAALESLLPQTGMCRVVLTGRRAVVSAGWQRFSLAPLSLAGSTKLLSVYADLDRFAGSGLRTTLQALAEQFEGMPLALSLAAGYLRDQAPASLSELDTLVQALTSAPLPAGATGPIAPLRQSLGFFLDQLDPAHPIQQPARRVLALAALFPPGQALDADLLRAMAASSGTDADGPVPPIAYLDDALALLRARSLLVTNSAAGLGLHRLVRTLVREQAEHRGAVVQASAALWHWLISSRPPAAQEVLEDLHAYVPLIRALAEDCAALELSYAAELAYVLSWYLTRNSELDEALVWAERAVTLAHQRWGAVHAITSEAYCRLGLARLLRNEFAAGHAAYARMLAIQAEIYPPDHPEALTGLKNMAQLLLISGQEAASLNYTQQAFQAMKRHKRLAEPDPAVVSPMRLARLLRLRGQQACQLGMFWRGYRYYEWAKRLAEGHQVLVAQLWSDRAHAALNLGRFADAEQSLDQASRVLQAIHANRRDVHGRYWHANLGEVALIRAQLTLAQGYPELAATFLSEAAAIVEPMLGRQSQEFTQVIEAQAEVALQRGQFAQATSLLDQAFHDYQRVFGLPNSYALLRIRLRQARLAMLLGQVDQAANACAEIRAGCVSKGTPDHPFALWAEALLAEQLRLTGQDHAAAERWAQLLPRLRRQLRNHPTVRLLGQQAPLPALHAMLIPI